MARSIISRNILVLSLSALLAVAQATAQSGGTPNRIKVPLKVLPFHLTDVRLLDGPFRDAMLRDQHFLLGIDLDRLLYSFRANAGLPVSAQPYGGWEAPTVELRGHSAGHFLTACSFMYAGTGDKRFKDRVDSTVAALRIVQDALPAKGFHNGYLSAFPEEFIDRVEQRKPVWAPYYTLHKIMAGLLDAYLYCGNNDALMMVNRMAAWVKFRMDRLTHDQQQAMLRTEFGGMSDVLANLYAVTGNPDQLNTARLFDDQFLFRPLLQKQDSLDGLHGNTQFPKMIGAVHEYELTGEQSYYDIAKFFWERVALSRSFVIGGNTNDESFFPIGQFSKNLGSASTEACNSYNMLKLTKELFELDPTDVKMEFYEQVLFNHILASQDPSSGMMCYYVPLKPGAFKTFSTPDSSFWCCVGTGMENHAKYGESIYFHTERDLYLNLFVASELRWKEKGLTLRQVTRFPEEEATHVSMRLKSPARFNLKIRYPIWSKPITVKINGTAVRVDAHQGSYLSIDRVWKNGDRVDLTLPMDLRLKRMPDDDHVGAVLYGPVVLAGDLGQSGLEEVKQYGPSAPEMRKAAPITIPAFVSTGDPRKQLSPVSGEPLTFETHGLGKPHDVVLKPFYKIFKDRYSVYWDFLTPGEWDARVTEQRSVESRRKEIERLTVDAVDIDSRENERLHGFKGEKVREHWFDSRRGRESKSGWFRYTMKPSGDDSLILVCTFRGSEGPLRSFDILVDSVRIADQSLEIHPGELFDFEYPLPASLTRGKNEITVLFRAHPNAFAGAVFDVRLVRQSQPIMK